jgi:hypothetical protein
MSANSNDAAFRHGRWFLVVQGAVFLVAGGWTLVMGLSGAGPVPMAMAGIVAVMGLASLVCALRRRAGAVLVCVQAPLFLILFMVSAATRHSGVWQTVFGYDSVTSLAYLVIGLLGLVGVMTLFQHALSERDGPSGLAQHHRR